MRHATFASLALLAAASTASAGVFSDCDYKAPRSLTAALNGATHIVVVGKAGSLKVTGQRGLTQLRATGTACTSERNLLNDIQLVARRDGNTVRLEAQIPEHDGSWFDWSSYQASLDFEVAVPDNIAIDIMDGSGEATIENVATARIADGSGSLHVRDVNGNLEITDGSGEITVENVTGDVRITDGSGSISIDKAGSVNIANDGSGSVDIMHVAHDVNIGTKGSGGVEVEDVGGNFIVGHKGSGHIDYASVRGQVQIPDRYRSGRDHDDRDRD